MKKYNKENIPLAKELRKNMTPWERRLWYDFLRSYPIRFQRQKAIGPYIADFYWPKRNWSLNWTVEDIIRTHNKPPTLSEPPICNK